MSADGEAVLHREEESHSGLKPVNIIVAPREREREREKEKKQLRGKIRDKSLVEVNLVS